MPEFIVEVGADVRRLVVDGTELFIGRDESNHLVVDDDRVSRRHARIAQGATGWFVEDLGSGNGTFMADARIRKAALRRGSVVTVGDSHITFLSEGADEAAAPPVPTGPTLEDGPRVAGYEVERLLGEGPMTTAWACRRGETLWTLRVLKPVWAMKGEVVRWLETRIDQWRHVDHPALVRLDLLRGEGDTYVIRERYADQGTLLDRSAAGKTTQAEALEIGLDLARAMRQLHDEGLCHGGIRMQALRCYSDSRARLSGPGVPLEFVDLVTDDFASHLACMAPEVFAPEGRSGRRTDVYALGAVLHHLLVGIPVAEGKTREAIERSVARGLFKTPQERRPTLVTGASDLLVACLAPDPADRPASMGEVEEVLVGLQEAAQRRPPVEQRQVQQRERQLGERPDVPKKSARHRAISYSITLVLLLLLNIPIVVFSGFYDNIFDGGSDEVASDTDGDGTAVSSARRDQDDPAVIERRVEALLDDDRFSEALSDVMGSVREHRLTLDKGQRLETTIKRRREARLIELTRLAEAALDSGDREAVTSALRSISKIAGDSDPDYKRLKARLDGM